MPKTNSSTKTVNPMLLVRDNGDGTTTYIRSGLRARQILTLGSEESFTPSTMTRILGRLGVKVKQARA